MNNKDFMMIQHLRSKRVQRFLFSLLSIFQARLDMVAEWSIRLCNVTNLVTESCMAGESIAFSGQGKLRPVRHKLISRNTGGADWTGRPNASRMKNYNSGYGVQKLWEVSKMGKKGFTLIELLIVIAILGILVALILPRFSDVRENANTKVCIANLRGLVSAMNTYDVQYNVDTTWGTSTNPDRQDVADLVALNLIATAVHCPVATNADYTITEDGNGDPAATCADASGDHKWP